MDLGISDKTALVMGSSSGLGLAIARALAEEGVRVALCSRSLERLEHAAQTLPGSAQAVLVAADLSAPGAGARAVEQAASALAAPIDILVTNTGGPPAGTFEELATAQWQAAYEALFLSATDAIRAALPAMRRQQWGRILLITSVAAKEPIARLTLSNALRAGLAGMTNSLSREVAAAGITVNVLMPGYTRTERLMQLGVDEAKICEAIPAGRLGHPSELGALAAFLASQQAAYITGQAIACDGGRMLSI